MASSSGVGKAVVIGGVGLGAYLLWRSMSAQSTAVAAGTTSTTTGFSLTDLVNALKQALGTPAASTTPAGGGTSTTPTTTASPLLPGQAATTDSRDVQTQKIIARAAGDTTTLYNVSQWNWFYQQVYGVPGIGLGDDGSPMTAGQYMALRVSNGISGMGAVAIKKPVVVIRGAEGRPVMVFSNGRRVVMGGGW
jgi:hypothetical protein